MEVEVLAFGQIAEITGKSNWKQTGVTSTSELIELLNSTYPSIKGISYKIAVDKKIIHDDTALHEKNVVALLPAFSGG